MRQIILWLTILIKCTITAEETTLADLTYASQKTETQKMQQKITKKGVGWAAFSPPPTILSPYISALANANLSNFMNVICTTRPHSIINFSTKT